MTIEVSQLYIYPVKSLGGVALDTMQLVDGGPLWDRRWMIVDAQGCFITQREQPRLALIGVAVDAGAACIRLHASGQDPLELPLVADGAADQRAVVWHDELLAVHGGQQARRWISAYLGAPAHFVYMPQEALRKTDQSFGGARDVVSFADAFPLLLIGEASLRDFNTHLDRPVEMLRFRPNIVVSGASAYAEDSWRRLAIGGVEYRVVKPCARCVIPSINRENAQKEPQVARALAKYRRARGGVYFGQNLIHDSNGHISRRDIVELLEAVA